MQWWLCCFSELHAYTLPQDKTQNAYEDAKIKAKQEAKDLGSTAKSEVDKYADKAFDKARGIYTYTVDHPPQLFLTTCYRV